MNGVHSSVSKTDQFEEPIYYIVQYPNSVKSGSDLSPNVCIMNVTSLKLAIYSRLAALELFQ